MHKKLGTAALLSMFLVAMGCRNNSDSFDYKPGTGNQTPTTQTAHHDDAGNQAHPDKADATAGMPAQTEPDGMSKADEATLQEMIKRNQEEIAFSQLGVRQLNRPALKATAEMLVEHHQQLLRNLQMLAKTKMVADTVATNNKVINAAKGDAFDKAWAEQQIAMHQQSITSAKAALQSVQSPAFHKLIEASIPVIESHLKTLTEQAPR